MIDWDEIRQILIKALQDYDREQQAKTDLLERLNIGRYVLRQKEASLGVSEAPRHLLSRKDIPSFLEGLQRPGGDNPGDVPPANRDRKS